MAEPESVLWLCVGVGVPPSLRGIDYQVVVPTRVASGSALGSERRHRAVEILVHRRVDASKLIGGF